VIVKRNPKTGHLHTEWATACGDLDESIVLACGGGTSRHSYRNIRTLHIHLIQLIAVKAFIR